MRNRINKWYHKKVSKLDLYVSLRPERDAQDELKDKWIKDPKFREMLLTRRAISEAYQENFKKLLSSVGKKNQDIYVDRERELNYLCEEIRKEMYEHCKEELLDYQSDTCVFRTQRECTECTGYYEIPGTKTTSKYKDKNKYRMCKATTNGAIKCFMHKYINATSMYYDE